MFGVGARANRARHSASKTRVNALWCPRVEAMSGDFAPLQERAALTYAATPRSYPFNSPGSSRSIARIGSSKKDERASLSSKNSTPIYSSPT